MLKKLRSPAVLLCALLSLLYFTSYITRLNFSASIAEMVQAGVFNKTDAGVIGTALFFAYGAGQLVSGVLSDKFDPGKIISAGLVLTVLCNAFFPFLHTTLQMSAVWGINGFAQALFWPPIVRILSHYYNDSGYTKGTLAVSYACHAATVLIYIIVPVGINIADWRFAFFFASLLGVAVLTVWCAGYPRLIKRMSAQSREDTSFSPQGKTPLLGALAGSGVLIITVAIALQGYLKDGIQSWLPTFFTEVFRMQSADAILLNILVPVSNMLFVSAAVFLFRRVFRNEVTESIFLFVTAAVLCLLLAMFYNASPVLSLVIAALITGCMHGVNSMLISFLPRRFERIGKAATVSGICNSAVYVGSAASSYGIALTASAFGWLAALLSWAAVALAGAAVCVFALHKWTRYIK